MRKINVIILNKYIESLGNKGIEKLAIKSDLSVSYLDKLRKGIISNPTLDTINKLCSATGFEFEKLFPTVGAESEAA